MYYWEYEDNERREVRRKYNVGDIKENAAKCHNCGDYIRSNNRHDYKACACGEVAVDGGSWYAKRTLAKNARFENIIVSYDDAGD